VLDTGRAANRQLGGDSSPPPSSARTLHRRLIAFRKAARTPARSSSRWRKWWCRPGRGDVLAQARPGGCARRAGAWLFRTSSGRRAESRSHARARAVILLQSSLRPGKRSRPDPSPTWRDRVHRGPRALALRHEVSEHFLGKAMCSFGGVRAGRRYRPSPPARSPGWFGIARTTGTLADRCFSIEAVFTAAATESTVCSLVTRSPISCTSAGRSLRLDGDDDQCGVLDPPRGLTRSSRRAAAP